MPQNPQTKICPRCHLEFSLYSERCPHCGKDSKYGTQAMGLFVTLGMLMLAPILIMLLIYLLY
jgi:predicted amidophosphoribosyltransferase